MRYFFSTIKQRRKAVVLGISIVQVLIIASLAFFLYEKHSPLVSFNTLDRGELSFQGGEDLEYFYEPEPNSQRPVNSPWLENVHNTINADALNERFDYPFEKSDGTFRIVTLGDSFTYGLGVATPDNYSEVLEDELNATLSCGGIEKFEVINLGFPGYDVEYQTERLRSRGMKYDPDAIVWLLKINDLSIINEVFIPKRDFYEKNMSEEEKQPYYDDGNFYPWALVALQDMQKELGREYVDNYQFDRLQEVEDFFEGDIAIFTLDDLRASGQIGIIERFQQSVGDRVHFLENINSQIHDSANRLPDHHPNEAGHRIIAEDLSAYLQEEGIIPCEQ